MSVLKNAKEHEKSLTLTHNKGTKSILVFQ